MGQLHQKLCDKLTNTRDKMEFLLTGKEPSVITNDTGNTIIEGDQSQEVIRYDRRNPVRACRKANRVWVNGVHGLDSQKLLKCLDVVLNDESIDFDIIQHDKSTAGDFYVSLWDLKRKCDPDKIQR